MPFLRNCVALSNRVVGTGRRAAFRLCRPKVHDLVIFDDIFPQPLSAFRLLEFTAYLENFPNAAVYSSGDSLRLVGEGRCINDIIADYETNHPHLRNRVHQFQRGFPVKARVAYCTFAANAAAFARAIDRTGGAIAFTLYPGGGFRLNVKESDDRLHRIMDLRSFRKVVVTQQITRDYLVGGSFCSVDQIDFVYGGVFPSHNEGVPVRPKPRFFDSKRTFDVCFVAHKYMAGGRDKGYDVFIEVAKTLKSSCPAARFHVVGPFTRDDLDVSALGDRIEFYGAREGAFFTEFYLGMDIILSPNAPFVLAPGAFDGFPTGACVEAALCGVIVVATDCLNQNVVFENGRDIVIVPRELNVITAQIERLYHDPLLARAIGEAARENFGKVFAYEAQMGPRLRLVEELLRDNK